MMDVVVPMTTSEMLDHTLQAYGRLERKHGETRRERDRYKAALDRLKAYPLLTRRAGPLESGALRIVHDALRGW
jgi:hypothetical protein